MPWEHITRKIIGESPIGGGDPELKYVENGQLKPIQELEAQNFEMVSVLPDQAGGGLPTGIFKRFVQEEDH
jgi:hypothetical protein